MKLIFLLFLYSISVIASNNYSRAVVAHKHGFYSDAVKLYRVHLNENPDDYYAMMNLGSVFYKMRDFSKANMQFSSIIEKYPFFADAYFNKGLVERSIGNQKRAVNLFKQSIKLKPNFDIALSELAKSYELINEPGLAKYFYNASIKEVNFRKVYLNYISYFAKNDFSFEAKKAYELLIQSFNIDRDIYDFAMFLDKQNLYDESIMYLNEYLKRKPNNSSAIYDLANVFEKTKNLEKAISLYKKNYFENNHIPSYVKLGEIVSTNNRDKSIEIFKDVIIKNPKNKQAYNNLFKYYLGNNNAQEAGFLLDQYARLIGKDELYNKIYNRLQKVSENNKLFSKDNVERLAYDASDEGKYQFLLSRVKNDPLDYQSRSELIKILLSQNRFSLARYHLHHLKDTEFYEVIKNELSKRGVASEE